MKPVSIRPFFTRFSFFVPVLEDAGLIYKLDLYMVEQALEKIRIMKEMGYETNPISVNLSRRDFDSCDIIEEITKRVDAAGMDARGAGKNQPPRVQHRLLSRQ